MRRLSGFLLTPLFLAAALAVPSSAAAVHVTSDPYRYTVVTNSCASGRIVFKVKFTSGGLTAANQFTIDSWAQWKHVNLHRWHTYHTWSQASSSFNPNGHAHSLTLRRSTETGGFESVDRITFKLQGWNHGLVEWEKTIHSTAC